ncbi:MAG: hypothetical protein HY226_02035 [Candidatus Vogelbacteria bacterium]|nr:hypothetical protein [Candidatus Vogelbacteria bacterium]
MISELHKQTFTTAILVLLITIQTLQLFTVAKIYYSSDAPETISYLNSNFPGSSIATLDGIEISSLLQTEKRFNLLTLTGMPTIGANPLLSGIFPEIVVVNDNTTEDIATNQILAKQYNIQKVFGRYSIFKIKI